MNYPKFIFEDVPLFLGLIRDLFPGLDCPRVGYPDFNKAVEESFNQDGYILLPIQIDKVVQLYETMMTRHSTMVVGPTGGGKTVVVNTLVKAQCILGMPTRMQTVNPKVRTVVAFPGFHPVSSRPAPLSNCTGSWILPLGTGPTGCSQISSEK